jgi:hypothetical protein
MTATLQQFTVGKRYALTFVGDADSHVVYEVLSRTAKSVTLTDGKEQITRRVTTFDNSEQVFPFGRYSMSPVLRAEPRTLSGGIRAGELPVGPFHTGR